MIGTALRRSMIQMMELRHGMTSLSIDFVHSIIVHLSELYDNKTSQGILHSICFSPDGNYLATAGKDKRIRVSNFLLMPNLFSLIS